MTMNYHTACVISPTTAIEKKSALRLSSSLLSSIFDSLSSNENNIIDDNNDSHLINNSNEYKEEWLDCLCELIESGKEKNGDGSISVSTINANVRKVKKNRKLNDKNKNSNNKHHNYDIRPRAWSTDDNIKSANLFLNLKKLMWLCVKTHYYDKLSSEESEEEK